MTPTRKNAIPGLIINGIIAVVGGIFGYMLLKSVLENGLETDMDLSGYGEMGMIFVLVVGALYLASALPLVYAIGVGVSAIFKLFQLLTGKWGFAVPSVILDCIWLVINFNLFAMSFSMPDGWIAAIPLGVLTALSVVSVVFDFKTFTQKNQD